MFDTILLRSFVVVVQEGGFTHAASRLNLTQSAVSAHLRRLEEQSGRHLLERTTRSIKLTADGELLLGYARAILALNHDAQRQLSGAPSEGVFRVGLSEDMANVRLMNVVQTIAARYPRVAVSVKVGIPGLLLESMDQGELDIVLGGRCHDTRVGRVLWREPLIWAGADWASFQAGQPVPLALFPQPCPYREVALAALARAGVDCRVAMVCSSGTGLLAAALTGFAITPIPQTLLVHGLRPLAPDAGLPSLPDVEFTAFATRHALAPIGEELCEVILSAFGRDRGAQQPVGLPAF